MYMLSTVFLGFIPGDVFTTMCRLEKIKMLLITQYMNGVQNPYVIEIYTLQINI